MRDILTYSGIVAEEESITQLKEDANNKGKPKPYDDDTAIAVF